MARVILIEANPFSPVTGAIVPVRLAGGGARPFNHRGYNDWRDCIVNEPTFTASIELSDAGWTGRSVPSASAIAVEGGTDDLVDDLMQLVWSGARLTMYSGDDALADPVWTIETKGNVADLMVRDGQMQIIMSDLSGDLDRALASDSFAGTGGLEGGAEAEGRTKRRNWGRVYNVEGRVLDKANNIYEFGDTYRPIQAFVSVKDRGRTGPINYVAWAGSAAATLAALQAASAPDGGAAVAASIACVKWWTQPAGPLTADMLGEIGSGYVETVAQIAQQIVVGIAPTINFAGLAAATAIRPDPAGIHVAESSTTAALALDQLLVQASLLWVLSPAGDIQLLPIGYDDPVETIVADQVERAASLSPVATFAVGYQHNEHVHSDGEISAALLGTDLVFADGRTGDALAAQLDDVQALADASASDIEAAADDGVLSRKEKSSVIVPRDDTLEKAWEFLDGRAATLSAFSSVSSARTVASDARSAWRAFRDAISPAWNNYDLDSAVNRVLLVGRLNDWDYSLDQLADAIRRAVAVNNVNLIPYSGFEQNARDWGVATNGAVTIDAGFPVTKTDSIGPYYQMQATSSGAGNYGFYSPMFAVTPGARYAAQVGLGGGQPALDRSTLSFQFFDGAGAYITTSPELATLSGGQPTNTKMRGFFVPPAGAVGARMFIVSYSNGTSGLIRSHLREPMVSSATADQTEFPSYNSGRQDGAQGIPGADGTSAYRWVAYADSPDGTLNFTNGAPGGRTYQGIADNKSTSAESIDPADYTWSQYVGPPNFGLVASAGAMASGAKIYRTASYTGAWNQQVYSSESFRGGAALSFRHESATGYMVALNEDPTTNADWISLDYAIYLEAGSGRIYATNNGVFVFDGGTSSVAAPGDTFGIQYDGKSVRYTRNGAEFFSQAAAVDKRLWFDSSLVGQGFGFTLLSFTGAGPAGNDGISPYMFALQTNSVAIQATYSGATKSGQLPRYVAASIKQGNADVTASASFTVTPSSTAIAATYSAGTITISQADASGYIDVTATIGATTIGTLRIQITRQLDPAPPASQTSGSAQIGGSFSNAAYPGIYGNSITLAANASGQLICNGGGEYDVSGGASTMSLRAGACFGYRAAGSSTWSYTSEVIGTQALYKATEDQSPGAVELSQTISGLTPGAFYEVILMIRRYTGSSGAIGFFAGQYSVSQ